MKKKRRILLLLAIIMTLSSSVFAADFADVKGHWAEEEIKTYANKGILKGYGDNSFRPDREMTRAEFVSVLNRLLNYGPSKDYTFKDVSKDDWFYSDICKAYENNYLEGYGDGFIDPYGYITREQAFKILGKIFDYKAQSVDKNFLDYRDLSSWAKEYTNGLINHGFVLGDSNGNLNPKSKISRSELVKLLNNIAGDLNYIPTNIEGNFIVRDNIESIRGKNIKGNLYIQADVLKENLTLKDFKVEGNIYILGSADTSLVLESTSANKIVSEKANVIARLDEESEIKIDEEKDNIKILKPEETPEETPEENPEAPLPGLPTKPEETPEEPEEKPEELDRSELDKILEELPSDLSIYTDLSVEALESAKELPESSQSEINSKVKALKEALSKLEEKPEELNNYEFVVNEKIINLKQGELVKVSGKFTKNKLALENKDINIRLNFLDHVGTTKTKEDGSFEYVFKLSENIKPGDHKLYINASKFEGFEGEKVEVLVRVIEKDKPVENKIKEVINPEPIRAYFKSEDSNEYVGLDLPSKVEVVYEDGSKGEESVEWNLKDFDPVFEMEYEIEGKIEGYDGLVVIKVIMEVKEEPIVHKNFEIVDYKDIVIKEGENLNLPDRYKVSIEGKLTSNKSISWEDVSKLELGENIVIGRFEDEGLVYEFEQKVIVEKAKQESNIEITFHLGSRDGKGGYNLTEKNIKEIKAKPGKDFPSTVGQNLVIYIDGVEEEITDKNIKVYLEDNLMEINPKFLYYDGDFDYTKLDLYGKRAKKGRTNLIVEVSLSDGSVVKESIEITIGDVAPEVEGEVELVSIENPEGITIDIEDLENIELPETVLAYFSDGTSKDLKVTWNTEYLDLIWEPSKFEIKGKIEGYDGDIEASLEINVIEKLDIVEIKKLEDIVINEGDKLALPETVEVLFEDGEEGRVELVWDEFDKLSVGEHIIKGKLKDYEDEIVELKIIVEKKAEVIEKIDLSKYNPKLEIFKHEDWGMGYISNNVRLICDEGLEEYYYSVEIENQSPPVKKIGEAMTDQWGLSILGDIKGKKGILKVYKGVEENGKVRAPRGDELKTNLLGELELTVVMEGEDPEDYENDGGVEVLGDRLEVSDMFGIGSYIHAYIDGYDGFEFKVPDIELSQIGKVGEMPISSMTSPENLIGKTYTVQITRNQGSVIVKELELKVYEKPESYRMKNSNLPEVYNLAA